uniref:SMC hinge domain-containing protein n=1 Tax=Quercus lobata TaxID=97700 RepID=A0A7N2N2P5_QUELO
MMTSGSLFVCESFNELKREYTRDEQLDLDLLTLRVLKDLILLLPKGPSLPLTSEEKKLQYRFKPTWGSFQRKRLNLGSSKPHTRYQLPNLNVKRKRFSQPTGIADPELKASLLQEGFACAAPKIITRLKIIPPKKPHLGISAASSIDVPNHSESPKPTPPRVIDGLNCQGLKLVTQKRRKATKEEQIEEKPPKKPKLNPTLPLSNPSPKLPQNFQNIIDTMGGTQLVLVIQKPLTKTDLNRHNARLSMPLSQINGSFLREAERVYLDQQQAMEVPFMEPSGKVNKIVLRQWDMPKESGKKSSCYVMIKSWNEELDNQLRNCKEDFKNFERQDVKYREDLKHMKQKIKKLEDKLEKESAKINNLENECENSKNLIPELEENIPKLQKLLLDEEKVLEEIKENSKVKHAPSGLGPTSSGLGPTSSPSIPLLWEKELKLRYRAELAKVRAEQELWEKQLIEHKGKLEVTFLKAILQAKESNQIEGIYGRMGDLGAIDAKYDGAISTACPRLDYIVVETTGEEGVLRLFDLIKVQDERMKPDFFAALGNTVVAKDLDQATRIAYNGNKEFRRVVTLDGALFETSGTMSGGGSKPRGGKMGTSIRVFSVSGEAVANAEKELCLTVEKLNSIRQRIVEAVWCS